MAQIKDFVVKQGIVAEGIAQSLATSSGALIVAGGAGVGGNINVGGSIKRQGNVAQGREHNIGAQLSLRDATFTDELIGGRTSWGIVNYFGSSVLDTISENATYTNAASIYVKGAPTGGTNLTIEKAWSLYITSGTMFLGETSGNTSTTSSQALQVAGGISFNNGMVGYGGGSLFGPWSLNSSEIITRANMNVGLAEFPDGIRITTSTQSISTNTGALVVDNHGGAGIGGLCFCHYHPRWAQPVEARTARWGSCPRRTCRCTTPRAWAGGRTSSRSSARTLPRAAPPRPCGRCWSSR
jgi:hypothetical protein